MFLRKVNFNYLSTTAIPIINITCFEIFSDRHNKTGLKLKKDLSRHLVSCINSKTNAKMISLILSQFQMIREVASINFKNSNSSKHKCFLENRKLFRPSKHVFVKYLVKFEKCFSGCCSYDVDTFIGLNSDYCGSNRLLSCNQCVSE